MKREAFLASMVFVVLAAGCSDSAPGDVEMSGPLASVAPFQEAPEGAKVSARATVRYWGVSDKGEQLLLQKSLPVQGMIRNGSASAMISLGAPGDPSVEIPLLRSRSRRAVRSVSERDEKGRLLGLQVSSAQDGSSIIELWQDFEIVAKLTYEYAGRSGVFEARGPRELRQRQACRSHRDQFCRFTSGTVKRCRPDKAGERR